MRIGFLHWAFPPVVGGVETHLEELGHALSTRGHSVAGLIGADVESAPQSHRGIRIHRHPLMQLGRTPQQNAVLDCLLRFVDRVQPDVLHAHNMHYFSTPHAEALGRLKEETGLPIVLTAHNVWHDKLGQAFLRYAPLWDQIIAVSHYLASALVAQGYPVQRIAIVHHGISPAHWTASPPPPATEPRIFHPARLSIDKGSLLLVRALRRVLDRLPQAKLLLTGTGQIVDFGSSQAREVRRVQREIDHLRVRHAVELKAIPWREMPAAYASSRVVAYPSRFDEPFGIAALEGMASTRPVVVSRIGGMPEFVRDGIDGFVVQPDDEQMLAARILELLENPALAERLGINARTQATTRFHLRHMTDKTLAVYNRLMRARGVPRTVRA